MRALTLLAASLEVIASGEVKDWVSSKIFLNSFTN